MLTEVDSQGWLNSSPFATESTKRLMTEAVRVAQAAGVPGIEDNLPDELIPKMHGLKGPVWTSMYYDKQKGRAMEVRKHPNFDSPLLSCAKKFGLG
jgi:ketopantoate reductase